MNNTRFNKYIKKTKKKMRICHIVIFTNSNNTTIESSCIGAFESSQGVRTLVRNGGTIRVSRGGLELL